VANARKLKLIYANKRKKDEIDAENLARLARLDPKLLYPLKHRSEDSQAHMALISSREALVSSRTQLVNHVRGTVKSFGHRLPKCPTRSFHKRASEHIPEALRPALGPILEQIGLLTERIRDYERQLEAISKEHYPETALLRQVEGIGPLTALTFVLTLENPLPLRKEPECRSIPGARASQGSVRREGSPETHLQGRRPDAKEAFGRQRPLHPRSLWLRFGPEAPQREAIFSRRQERTPRSGRWWAWPGSSRCSCTACG
jgi:transposase